MDTFQKYMGVLAVIMVIAGAAAFVWAYYMASLNKAQLEGLRGDRDDLQARVSRLEKELTERDVQAAKRIAENDALQTKITVLEGIVTHDTTIKLLMQALQEHDANVEKKYTEYMQVTGSVLEHVERMLDLLERKT